MSLISLSNQQQVNRGLSIAVRRNKGGMKSLSAFSYVKTLTPKNGFRHSNFGTSFTESGSLRPEMFSSLKNFL
jgi:hypothetical protein